MSDETTVATPRALDLIQKDAEKLWTQAGLHQYNMKILETELHEMNRQILKLNQEAAASKALNPTPTTAVTPDLTVVK